MTPSNPSNGQPLIFRICDALGINHLVACFNHTHEQSEVEGLPAALSAKANASDMTAALAGKQNTLTFDTTPTAGSNNPVTSGGIKTALDAKQNTLTFDNTPTANSNNPVKSSGIFNALGVKVNVSDVMPEFLEYDGQDAIDLDSIIADSKGVHRLCIQNTSGGTEQFENLFVSSDGRNIHVNINSSAQIDPSYYAIATIYKIDDQAHEHDVCYFIELNGIFNDGN